MYRTLFPRDLFSELDRLQRDIQQAYEPVSSIRGLGRGGFPALNVGNTAQSVELQAFAPGLDPATLEVNLERGVLTVSGERKAGANDLDKNATVHMHERFAGSFRRVVSLPDDIDPDSVSAQYRDGVLRISIRRRESVLPRRITIQ